MFQVITNNGAIAQQQIRKEVAKLPAREILKERAAGAIVQIGADERGYVQKAAFKHPSDNIKAAKVYKASYERTLPETLDGQTQSLMWKRAKQLKDEFTNGMLTKSDLHPVKGFLVDGKMNWVVDEEKMRNNRSVERELAWQKANEPKIKEFKNIMRHLNPDDPNAGDVEKYRSADRKG